MSATGWLIIAVTGFAMAGLCLAFAVWLFIWYKIPEVLGDLSGRRAAKEVAALRGGTEGTRKATDGSGHTADFHAMAVAHESKRLDKKTGEMEEGSSPTEAFPSEELRGGEPEAPITGVLDEPQTIGITQVLNETGAPVVPEEPEEAPATEDLKRVLRFEIVRSVTEIHTEEYV